MVNVGDQFDSMVEARDAVWRFILDDGELYGYGPGSKLDKKRTIMTCKETTCKFRIRIIAGKKGVKVTKMLPHTCTPVTHYKSTGLRDRAGRGERARQWRQEQEAWEVDVMMEAIEQEVEAQVRREAGDGDVDIDSDSELSLLQSSDFEGIEL